MMFGDADAAMMASLHDVAVIEAARCRGIGLALVTAAGRHASARKCDRICLISSAMGESVYRRAGFEGRAHPYCYRGKG